MAQTASRVTPSLWRDRNFTCLWTGRTISAFGSHITSVALPLTAVLTLGATPGQMGVLAALGSLPVLVIGLPVGAWVDRMRRRPVLIAADLGRAALLVSIPIAALLGVLRIDYLYIVAPLAGTLTVIFDVADPAYLPVLVAPERLVEGNSKLAASGSIAEIAGPSLAGVLVQWISAPLAIAFDAVSFVVSALCMGLIHAHEPKPAHLSERRHIGREIKDGMREVVDNPLLRALAGTMATFTFFGNFIGTLYVIYILRVLHAPAAVVGALIGLGGVGALVGALVVGSIVRRIGVGRALIGAMIFYGCTDMVIPLAGGPTPIAVSLLAGAQLVGDVAIAVYLISDVSLRQSAIPTSMLGRANASMQVLERGLAPAGALIAGILGSSGFVGMRLTIAIGALGVIGSSLWLICSPVRSMRVHG